LRLLRVQPLELRASARCLPLRPLPQLRRRPRLNIEPKVIPRVGPELVRLDDVPVLATFFVPVPVSQSVVEQARETHADSCDLVPPEGFTMNYYALTTHPRADVLQRHSERRNVWPGFFGRGIVRFVSHAAPCDSGS